MKYLVLIFIALILVGAYAATKDSVTPSTKMGRSIIKKVSRDLAKKHHMEHMAIDEAGDDDAYTLVGAGFSIDRALDKDEARKIVVDATETFLSEINARENFKQYMSQYPFTLENVSLMFFFKNADGSDLYYPDIGTIDAFNGRITYYYNTPENIYGYHSIEEESFEEAKKKVNQQ